MEQIAYEMIFRRFVALSKHVPLWDVTVFTKNRNRLLEAGIARAYLTAVRCDPNVQPVLSGEHLSVMAHRSKLRPAWRVSSRSWFCRPAGASSQRRSGFPRQAAQQRNRCLNRRSRSAALLESSRTGGGKSGSKRRLWSCYRNGRSHRNRCEAPTAWGLGYLDTSATRWGIQKSLIDGTTMGMS